MSTRWVHRNDSGVIDAHFAQRQPGFAEEELPFDHPDLQPDSKAEHNASIDAQIAALELASGGYVRGVREYFLLDVGLKKAAGQFLAQQTDPQVQPNADIRAFAQVMKAFFPDASGTPGMVKIKQLDDQIKALRSQRIP